ncbi:YdbC family protein [Streptococcus rifensis]
MTDWQRENGWQDQQNNNKSSRHPTKDNHEPIRFKLVKHIATLSTAKTGWKKELNVISWNDAEPKYDIRSWKDDRSRVGKGVTLFEDEMKVLKEAVSGLKLDEK